MKRIKGFLEMYAEKTTEGHAECESEKKKLLLRVSDRKKRDPLQEQRAVENLTESNRAGNSWTFRFWSLKHFAGLLDSERN